MQTQGTQWSKIFSLLHDLERINKSSQDTKFHLNQLRNLKDIEDTSFRFLVHMWLWMKVKVIQTGLKLYTLVFTTWKQSENKCLNASQH